MAKYKPPGVYVEEVSLFLNSVVQVPTDIPVFIGYTQTPMYEGQDYTNRPFPIYSRSHYELIFGPAPQTQFRVVPAEPSASNAISLNGKTYTIDPVQSTLFYLYNSIRHFYANGGGMCYIVSVGDFDSTPAASHFTNALKVLETEADPTIIVAPDSLLLSELDNAAVMQAILAHCNKMQNRFSILDILDGQGFTNADQLGTEPNIVTQFRQNVGQNYLNYGAAYFPWLQTAVVQNDEVDYRNLGAGDLNSILENTQDVSTSIEKLKTAFSALVHGDQQTLIAFKRADNDLQNASPNYKAIINKAVNKLNILPPGPAMAGIYTNTDNNAGVWEAPANVSVNLVTKPLVRFNDQQQGDFNVPVDGKAINILRSFPGRGVLVWGARTLDGNSEDWRYISVRRTMIMIEQSIKQGAAAYVFAPNDSNTWAAVKSTIDNFLLNIWKQGGLMGGTPNDAFNVTVGFGSTMTSQDILNGYMNIMILVALIRPAEFIVISFRQQMQAS